MVLSVRTFSFISAQVAADGRAEPHRRRRRLQQGKLRHDLLAVASHVQDHDHALQAKAVHFYQHSAMKINLK